MSQRFDDKVALVTGGASAIGRAVNQRLIDDGARVAIVDPRPGKRTACRFIGLTKCAAMDYADKNARVNVVAPGPVAREMFLRWLPTPNRQQVVGTGH